MFSTLRASALAIAAALTLGLGGCSLVQVNSDDALTGIEQCALDKTWSLDMTVLAEQVKAVLEKQGIAASAATAEGTQTLEWSSRSEVVLQTDYTITVTTNPAADQALVMTDKHSGTATGIAYINAEVAIPRDWDATGLDVKASATLNDEPVEELPYAMPPTDLDDSVGIELTCEPGTLTTHQRGTDLTLKWTSG